MSAEVRKSTPKNATKQRRKKVGKCRMGKKIDRKEFELNFFMELSTKAGSFDVTRFQKILKNRRYKIRRRNQQNRRKKAYLAKTL
jgi:hypothetical protein